MFTITLLYFRSLCSFVLLTLTSRPNSNKHRFTIQYLRFHCPMFYIAVQRTRSSFLFILHVDPCKLFNSFPNLASKLNNYPTSFIKLPKGFLYPFNANLHSSHPFSLNATRLRLSFLNNKQDATQITAAPTIIAIVLKNND